MNFVFLADVRLSFFRDFHPGFLMFHRLSFSLAPKVLTKRLLLWAAVSRLPDIPLDQFALGAKSADQAKFLMGCSCSQSVPRESSQPPTLLQRKLVKHGVKSNVKGQPYVSCHASEGATWHLELLAMSADLRQKLQDPHFVATRCDLDGSGNLDEHELKQAAQVYGLNRDDLPALGEDRISNEGFAELVASRGTKQIRAFESTIVTF